MARSVQLLRTESLHLQTLQLFYTTLDNVAWAAAHNDDVRAADFVAWVSKYISGLVLAAAQDDSVGVIFGPRI